MSPLFARSALGADLALLLQCCSIARPSLPIHEALSLPRLAVLFLGASAPLPSNHVGGRHERRGIRGASLLSIDVFSPSQSPCIAVMSDHARPALPPTGPSNPSRSSRRPVRSMGPPPNAPTGPSKPSKQGRVRARTLSTFSGVTKHQQRMGHITAQVRQRMASQHLQSQADETEESTKSAEELAADLETIHGLVTAALGPGQPPSATIAALRSIQVSSSILNRALG